MTCPSQSHAVRVGGVFVVLYALCIAWPMIFPYAADVQAFHLLSLKLAFPGFQGFALGSIVWGAVMSFAYGAIASTVFHAMHAGCCKAK